MRQYGAALAKPATREKSLSWVLYAEPHWDRWADRTFFVDESTFHSSTGHRKRAWIPKTVRRADQPIDYVTRSGRVSVTAFGGLFKNQLLPLYRISRTLDSFQYMDVLQELYWPIMQELLADDDDFRYVQDNCPAHKASVVKEFLAEEHPRISRSVWQLSPYSPDLNPIEHVWSAMKSKQRPNILTADALWEETERNWDEIGADRSFLQDLTASMPDRLAALRTAGGGPTKY